MTPQEAIAYIETGIWSTMRLGLDRTYELLDLLGNPQKKLKFIHVAGSNGKGSTCAMLDEILRRAGYRTGLYTSPYILSFCERMRVSGEDIPGEKLAEVTEKVKALAESMEDHPSQFEMVTAIALEYFYQSGCDIVVLEVGLGGETDSTNAIDAPEVAVITNIGLEHTEYLGDTLEKIAAVKGGIIKTGCHAVCYDGAPEVSATIAKICEEKQVPLNQLDFSGLEPLSQSLMGQEFRWKGQPYRLKLTGPHQLCNAAVVLETVECLRTRGWKISDEAVREGLEHVFWPARMEVLQNDPLMIVDGGHNPQCAQMLKESLHQLLPGRKVVFLAGVLEDKDYPRIMDLLMPVAQEFVCLTPVNERALPAEKLAEHLRQQGANAVACETVEEGLLAARKAAGEDGIVVAFGSLYLAGVVRKEFFRMSGKN